MNIEPGEIRERVKNLLRKLEMCEEENKRLRNEVERLKKENSELRKELSDILEIIERMERLVGEDEG